MPCIWNDWLPEPLATQVRTEEPRRFAALIDALEKVWKDGKAAGHIANAATATFPYIPLVKAMINSKAEPDPSYIQRLVDTLLDIVLSSPEDLSTQSRWANVLHRLLRTHSRKLSVLVPWRPLYETLRAQGMEPSARFEGAGVMEARRTSLVQVAHRSRRFFPPGSAAEIWAEFSPALRDPSSPDAFEAAGWLCMLMPTQAALRQEGDWGVWAREWVELMGAVAHNQYLQALWFSLFARLIKHDLHGMVDWPELLPEICSRFMWAFHLPVGSATASPPFSGAPPAMCAAMFANEMQSRSASVAKAIIYLIGRLPVGSATDDDPALTQLEATVALLEQYYHPSNGGKWTPGLATFLREATAHLCRRLVAEHYVKVGASSQGEDSDEESDDEDEEESEGESEDGGGGVDSSSTDDEMAGEPAGGAAAAPAARRHITLEARHRLVAALVRLAAKGQSAKDRGLRRASSGALALLANVEPDVVLPLVHRHFATAMETVTAARQYGNAIQTLSLCARPLLLAGLQPAPADELGSSAEGGEGGLVVLERAEARAAAAQSLASAMMATLPGIDANDPPKSLAVFRLYCCILSCAGELPDSSGSPVGTLPLYTEEWTDELLSRVFTVISNLDAPDRGGDEGGHGEGLGADEPSSFLLDGNSMFRPLMELLFVRLPFSLRPGAIRRTAAFLLENTFSSVTAEAAILCNAVAWADPETTSNALLAPLLRSLEKDAKSAAAATDRLSKVQETSLKWRLGLLSSTAYHLGTAMVPHGPAVRAVLSSLVTAPSQAVQEAAGRALSSFLVGLCTYYPLAQYAANRGRLSPSPSSIDSNNNVTNGNGGLDGVGAVHVECFVDKLGNGGDASSMHWHIPSEAETSLANATLEQFLQAPSQRLLELCSGGTASALSKDSLRSLLLQMEGALGGARGCLPDFPVCTATTRPDSAALIGWLGATIGKPAMREMAAEAVVAVSEAITPSDAESLHLCLRVMDLIMAVGSAEHSEAEGSAAAWASDDRWMQEPAVAGHLLQILESDLDSTPAVGYGPKWRRRRPMWLASEKVFLNLQWRASQACYRWYPTPTSPAADVTALPPAYLKLVARSIHFVTRGLLGVREVAASVLERCLKRYPGLTPAAMVPIFGALAKVEDLLEFVPGRSPVDVIPTLRIAAQQAPALAAAAAGETESEQDQSMAIGAATLFRAMSIWRYVIRSWEGFHALCLALMASAAHTGAEAQSSLTLCSFMLILRHVNPPSDTPAAGAVAAGAICADAVAAAAPSNQPGSFTLPWRYAAAANGYPLLMLAAVDAPTAAGLMRHFVSQLDSDILITRQLATAGVTTLLLPLWCTASSLKKEEGGKNRGLSPETVTAASEALSSVLLEQAGDLIPRLFTQLAYGHSSLASGGDAGQRAAAFSLSRDDMVSKTLTATLTRGAEWPGGKGRIASVSAGHFVPQNARLIQTMVLAAPDAMLSSLRGPIEAALAKPQDADRPAVAAAAEALAGVVASGVPFENGAWTEWVCAAFTGALAAAPLDFVDLWGSAALRYAIHGLIEVGKGEFVTALLEATLQATGGGSSGSGGGGLVTDSSVEPAAAGSTTGGSGSGALYRRTTYLTEALSEFVLTVGSGRPPHAMRILLAIALDELPALAKAPGEMVRQAAAGLAADVAMALLEPRTTTTTTRTGTGTTFSKAASPNSGNNDSPNYGSGPDTVDTAMIGEGSEGDAVLLLRTSERRLRTAAAVMLERIATGLDAGTVSLYARARAAGGPTTTGLTTTGAAAAADFGGVGGNDADIMQDADDVARALVAAEVRATSASQEVKEQEERKKRRDSDVELVAVPEDKESLEESLEQGIEAMAVEPSAVAGGDVEYETALTQVAFAVEVVVQLLSSNSAAAEIWVVRMLPSLLRLQDLIPSELQVVGMVASKALRAAKYQPLAAKNAAAALRVLRSATHAELWTERAAALAFLQYFWFRHAPLLGASGTSEVVAEVVARLEDQKLEVRELAAITLSGVLRGLPPSEQLALRRWCLATAAELFPGRRRRRRVEGFSATGTTTTTTTTTAAPSIPQTAPLPERHGAALALAAFVLSSPYDVPSWLPEVLMALVQLASEPAPIKTTVTRALADFRRTHEEGGLVEVKDALTAEQWEAIRDVASPASYFV